MEQEQERKQEEGYRIPLKECPSCGFATIGQHVLDNRYKLCINCHCSWKELENGEVIFLFDPRHEEEKYSIPKW